jgi:hypothetical protein
MEQSEWRNVQTEKRGGRNGKQRIADLMDRGQQLNSALEEGSGRDSRAPHRYHLRSAQIRFVLKKSSIQFRAWTALTDIGKSIVGEIEQTPKRPVGPRIEVFSTAALADQIF